MLLFVLCQEPGSCCTIIHCINTHFFQQYPAPTPAHFILWFSHSFTKEEGSCREVCALQRLCLCISAHQSHSFPSPLSVPSWCDVAAFKHYLFYNQVKEWEAAELVCLKSLAHRRKSELSERSWNISTGRPAFCKGLQRKIFSWEYQAGAVQPLRPSEEEIQ